MWVEHLHPWLGCVTSFTMVRNGLTVIPLRQYMQYDHKVARESYAVRQIPYNTSRCLVL